MKTKTAKAGSVQQLVSPRERLISYFARPNSTTRSGLTYASATGLLTLPNQPAARKASSLHAMVRHYERTPRQNRKGTRPRLLAWSDRNTESIKLRGRCV